MPLPLAPTRPRAVGDPLPALALPVGRRPRGLILARDRFNRADSATVMGSAETGQAWSAASNGSTGVWGITAGAAYCISGVGADHIAFLDCGRSDWLHLACDLLVPSGGVMGLLFRYQDVNNYLALRYTLSTSTLAVFRNLATTRTAVFSQPVSGLAADAAGTHRLEVWLRGTRIFGALDGVVRIGGTDTNFLDQTNVGFYTTGTGTTVAFDNLLAEAA